MDKNRIEGAAEQGEPARNREALVIKVKRRKSGGCAAKGRVLTWEISPDRREAPFDRKFEVWNTPMKPVQDDVTRFRHDG
jgi:hypothetical protein